ncbi:unnamed protein product [Cuscuta epithymum]|uniref:No apical meristem-associated C-terminal domain-containing protein n=1 Tax=Cuscuta epithymum TaxID=186058 RepID=A0AAV0CBV1_9ASTE|nr:unnamed protein product [Cuscuta epithymum]
MSSQRRGVNWSVSEDIALCKAWVKISEAGAIAFSQGDNCFWGRVHDTFSQNSQTVLRTRDAVESRFKTINRQCCLWKEYMRKATTTSPPGFKMMDVEYQAKVLFRHDNNDKPFKFDHAWHVLHTCQKWYHQNEPLPALTVTPPSHNSITLDVDSSSNSPSNDTSGSIPHPGSRDKQRVDRKCKEKMPRMDPVIKEHFDQMIKQGEESGKKRYERYDDLHRRAMESEIRKNNVDIVTMDLSKYSPRKKKWLEEQQNAIMNDTQDQ